MALRGIHKRYLRGLAHGLSPIVQLGKAGLTDGIVAATDQALTDHELVKVRLPQVDKAERKTMAEALGEQTHAVQAGLTGRMLILYRRHPDEPKIELPRSSV